MWKTRFAFVRDTRKHEDGLCKLIYTRMMTKHILSEENGEMVFLLVKYAAEVKCSLTFSRNINWVVLMLFSMLREVLGEAGLKDSDLSNSYGSIHLTRRRETRSVLTFSIQ